jgi:nucleotide-binding universal stress UspA family protein
METTMLKIERILCPVDFSEFSIRAYEYAHSFARHYGAKLFIQHVAEPFLPIHHSYVSQPVIDQAYSQQLAEAEQKFRELTTQRNRGEVETDVVLERGPVADSILLFAEAKNIDLIAMGTHGRRGLDRLVLGSVTERVLRKAQCPVLAVHNPAQAGSGSQVEPVQIRKILFCTDFSDNSPRALEYALLLACQYKAEISLLHVIERSSPGRELDAEKEQGMKHLQAIVPENVRNCVTIVPAVRAGKAYQEILEHAAETQTDLVVMGVRGRNAVNIALFGSTTHRVLQLGQCPVLVVRT